MATTLLRGRGRHLVGWMAAAFLAMPVSIARAETVHTAYSISLIGLPFGTAIVNATFDPAGPYRLDLSGKLTGLASILSSSKTVANATGALQDNHVNAATYATTSVNANMTRTVRMTVVNNNVDKAEIDPPWSETPDRVPVTDADRRSIVDPISALVMTVPGSEDPIGPAACNRTIPVFDGAARFDIAMQYVGIRQVKTHGYAGPVAVCSVRYRPIAGHRSQRPGTKFMADNKQIEAWLAPIAGTRVVVPYRLSILTMIGTVVAEATNFEVVGDAHAAAPQR